jgi:hypothetical protein
VRALLAPRNAPCGLLLPQRLAPFRCLAFASGGLSKAAAPAGSPPSPLQPLALSPLPRLGPAGGALLLPRRCDALRWPQDFHALLIHAAAGGDLLDPAAWSATRAYQFDRCGPAARCSTTGAAARSPTAHCGTAGAAQRCVGASGQWCPAVCCMASVITHLCQAARLSVSAAARSWQRLQATLCRMRSLLLVLACSGRAGGLLRCRQPPHPLLHAPPGPSTHPPHPPTQNPPSLILPPAPPCFPRGCRAQ